MEMKDVVIVSAARTAFGNFGGLLKDVSSIRLSAIVLREVLKRSRVPSEAVNEVYFGVCFGAEAALAGGVVARQATLEAGYPHEVNSVTIDRACCSSMTALQLGRRAIASGEAEVVVVGGAENLSHVPYLVSPSFRWGTRLGNLAVKDPLYEMGFPDWSPVSVDADDLAREMGVTRQAMDEWAILSQRRYAAALKEDKYREEIIPFEVTPQKGTTVLFDKDESPRPQVTLEKLATLPTVYGCKSITAGNAPGLNTGASAIMLMSRSCAERLHIQPLAKIVTSAWVSAKVGLSAVVPAYAIQRMLEQTGFTIDQLELIEINEAFAAMPLCSSLILAGGDNGRLEKIRERINVNGGAIAIGHPIGASGTRLALTLMYEMRRRGSKLGAAAICGALAQGEGVLLQREL